MGILRDRMVPDLFCISDTSGRTHAARCRYLYIEALDLSRELIEFQPITRP